MTKSINVCDAMLTSIYTLAESVWLRGESKINVTDFVFWCDGLRIHDEHKVRWLVSTENRGIRGCVMSFLW